MKAVWNGVVLAQSGNTVRVDGNHYFPFDSVRWAHFTDSDNRTHCFWKGFATYYHVQVEGKRLADAAWTYRDPKPAASDLKDRVAFWNGVQVLDG